MNLKYLIMKKSLIVFILMIVAIKLYAQMPRNGDYSDWDWEDQSRDNWQRRLDIGENDPENDGDGWAQINPPFLPAAERVGDIVDVFATQDYTREKGWNLIWAQFDGIYPYFILYNKHKSLVRVFFYLGGDEAFTNILATLSFHEDSSPGILAYVNEGIDAPNKYVNGEREGNDIISVVIPGVGLRTWCSADFPIFFDNNIQNQSYSNKKWVFRFYGADEYGIRIKGRNVTPPGYDSQHTISGGSTFPDNFSAQHAKFHKQLKNTNSFLNEMKSSVSSINENSPPFLYKYKKEVDKLSGLRDIFSAAISISSGVGAVLGFVKTITGIFNKEESPKPSAIIQYVDLEGSMNIQRSLGGNTLKIPGVRGNKFPNVPWNPYNCPLGFVNLKKAPVIKATRPYRRYGCLAPYTAFLNRVDYISGYSGMYRKYKLNEDIHLALNEIDGLELVDIHFAIVCKPNGSNERNYSIKDRSIALYRHYLINGQGDNYSVPNPIYKALEDGRFIIHKFDEENNEVYFGTPYLQENELKGVIFEVPEDTDVRLRVYAKFNSSYYQDPVIFQADYNFDIQEEAPNRSIVSCNREQTNFLFSDYYTGAPFISLGSDTFSDAYSGQTIELTQGFIGNPSFQAEAIRIYPTNGNTVIDRFNFNCDAPQVNEMINFSDINNNNALVIYPNPTNNTLTIELAASSPKAEIHIFNTMGKKVYQTTPYAEVNKVKIDVRNWKRGIYLIKVSDDLNKYPLKKVIVN